jgi:hypothetical protein
MAVQSLLYGVSVNVGALLPNRNPARLTHRLGVVRAVEHGNALARRAPPKRTEESMTQAVAYVT